jgi:hypothetical protein
LQKPLFLRADLLARVLAVCANLPKDISAITSLKVSAAWIGLIHSHSKLGSCVYDRTVMGRGQLKYSRRARGRGRGGRGGRGEAAEAEDDASIAPDIIATDRRDRAVRGLPSNADRFVERDESGAAEYEYSSSIGTSAGPKEHYETALEQDDHDGLASLSIVSPTRLAGRTN